MHRSMTDEDMKKRRLIMALIECQGARVTFTEDHLNQSVPRYLRELARLGVNAPDFYENITTDEYPEVYDAVIYCWDQEIIGMSTGNPRITRLRSCRGSLFSGLYLTREEGVLALQAAQIAVEKFNMRQLDDDLTEENTETAIQE
jgi:hypothetical protein